MTTRSRRAGAAAVCLLLAVVHTWPLARHPAKYSRNDNGDAQLNEWILAWVEHELPRNPARLFDANIFYPAHDVLAFSEPLIVPAIMGAPIAWLGGSPVLVFNLLLIAGFALTAFATYWVVDAWTGDGLAGLLAGSVFAFNTHTLTRLPHVQAVHIYGLPLALLAIDRLLRARRLNHALWLVVWIVVLAYTSGYLFVFACVMTPIAVAARLPEWRRHAAVVLSRFSVAAAASAMAILPLAIPYIRVAREQHMVRTLDAVAEFSARPRGYLVAFGRIHFALWSHVFGSDPVDAFFPGFVVLAFAVWAAIAAFRSGDERRVLRARTVMLLAIAGAGFVLSLGPATPLYGWLFAVFPPLRGLRAAARFGNLFLLGVALLGGLGMAWWRARARTNRDVVRWAVVALVILANLESLRAPFDYREFTGIPELYQQLATAKGPVVVAEQPFYPPQAVFENAPYVLNSTAYWRPLMNGYSGYTPDSYVQYAAAFWYFPEPRAIEAMEDAGVTHVVVHPHRFLGDADKVMQQVEACPDLELLAIGGDDVRLYRLKRPANR
ncbi:MAG: hypothetical protein ACRD1V_06875 [Vicinamibacterales bacterium]